MARALLLSVLGVVACTVPPLQSVRMVSEGQIEQTFCAALVPAVDVLIVMDEAPTMIEEAPWIARGLEVIAAVYDAPGRALDYRIAVVSSSLEEGGVARFVDTSCRERLDDFVLAPGADLRGPACSDVCTRSTLSTTPTIVAGDPLPRPRPWIESVSEANNMPGDVRVVDDLPCRGALGFAEDGPRRPLAAMASALAQSRDHDDPAFGFLRDEAALFVLFVTDADDESPGDVSEYTGLLASIRDWKGGSVFVSVIGGVGERAAADDEHVGCESDRGKASPPHRLAQVAAEFAEFPAWGGAGLFSICGDPWEAAPACVPGAWAAFSGPLCLEGCVHEDAPLCEIERTDGVALSLCDVGPDGSPILPEGMDECAAVRTDTLACDAELVILQAQGRPSGCYRATCEVGVGGDRTCAGSLDV